MRRIWRRMVVCFLVLGLSATLGAWPLVYPTGVTVYRADKTFNGYTLFLSMATGQVFLIDMEGNIKRSWDAKSVGWAELAELLPNGHLLVGRTPLTEFDWDGKEVWKVEDPESHHDFFRLPNGNTLVVSGEKLVDPRLSDKEVTDDIVYEITPSQEKVWVWRTREHLDELGLSEEARRLIRETAGDWAHMNSMEPLPENPHQNDPRFRPGNILVDYRHLNTLAIIDRQSGKIVWRLGPDYSQYPEIGQIIGQHNVYMIPKGLPGEGNILIYDNGGSTGYPEVKRPTSRVVEIDPVNMKPVWQYPKPPTENMYQFFSFHISGAQRLPNGNTLITEGMNGRVFEVTPDCEIVWEFVCPFGKKPDASGNGSMVFRATRYTTDYIKQPLKLTDKDKKLNSLLSRIRKNTTSSIKDMEEIQKIVPAQKAPAKAKAPAPAKAETQPAAPAKAETTKAPRRDAPFFDFIQEGGLYDAPAQRSVSVDCSKEVGPIKFIMGTNRGPEGLTGQFNDLGITAIRTHDFYGPTDWWVIFPNWSSDPENPASYDFESSDKMITPMHEGGFKIMYRLGVSWRGGRSNYSNDPPGTIRDAEGKVTHEADAKDFEKFAKICVNTARHYNEGWANGYRYDIKYWEVWNEPSLKDQFWTGTAQQFYEMYAAIVKAMKAHDSNLIVGGPGRAAIVRGRQIPEYQVDFFAYCAKNKLPLDFYSWHQYGDPGEFYNPHLLYEQSLEIRKQLDDNGFAKTELLNNEFNETIRPGTRDDGYGAAFYASALISMLRSGNTQAYQYRGTTGHGLGLFKDATTPKRSAYGLKAFTRTIALPVQARSLGDDEMGYNTLATMDKSAGTVRILISDYRSKSKGLKLSAANLPWGKDNSFTARVYLVDNDSNMEVADEKTHKGNSFEMSRPMTAGSVLLVELQKK